MAGSFVADSSRVVLKLLASDLAVEAVLATPDWYVQHEAELLTYPTLVCYVAEKTHLEEIVGFNLHEGVMARAPVPGDVPLSSFYQQSLIVLDGIMKAENVGAIIRNAGAFGIWNLLISHDTCHPYNRRSARVAMGNLFRMRVHQTPDLPQALQQLRANGVQVYGFENRPFAQDLETVKFAPHSALVIGSEGAGIRPKILAESDHFVRIPIDEQVFALNAACASAVALYAFSRQTLA